MSDSIKRGRGVAASRMAADGDRSAVAGGATVTGIRDAMEAHALACREASTASQPRPNLPNELRANLADANLADANLAGANLADANLARANLADANLARANLADANLADANLAGANLADANLADAYLAGAYLAGANLAGVNLAGAYLARANLADANLAGANLADANLARANLAGVNGIRAAISIGPIGSRLDLLTAILGDDGAISVSTGCFHGDLTDFAAAVDRAHGGNEHGLAYRAAIELIRVRFGMAKEVQP